MNRSIFLLYLMETSNVKTMEIPIDEMERIQEMQESASHSSSMSSSPENAGSLSSSPEEEYMPAQIAPIVLSKAHFFCKMCRKKNGTLGKRVRQQPGENANLIEHLILVHRACLDCCVNYKMNFIFNTSDLAREHIRKEHRNPISYQNTNDKLSLFEQMVQEIKEKKKELPQNDGYYVD